MSKDEKPKIFVPCAECGGRDRNHEILFEHSDPWATEDDRGEDTYQICKCCGCNTIRFRRESWSTDDWNHSTNEMDSHVDVYPEFRPSDREPKDWGEYPREVAAIYRETIQAFNVGAFLLTGGGLRAIVEAICIDQDVTGKLYEKINALADKGLLAQPQADLLHEERYIGNAALHEIAAPSRRDIEDGLAIVEGLLDTIYVLPGRADRLKRKRTQVP